MPQTAQNLDARPDRSERTPRRVWTGRVLSAIPILFMLFDAGIKLAKAKAVTDGFAQMGYPVSLAQTIGVIALVCTAIYAIPRTSVLGAVLITGYLGGAISTQLRIQAPAFPTLFPLVVAAFIWGGLFLRDERLLPLLIARR
jgi:uncharacterized membrane protein (UPF0182 family)